MCYTFKVGGKIMFTIYSKYGCPYCEKIKSIMELSDQEFVTYELGVDYNREEFYEKFGQGSTFPQVVHNDKNLGGCTDTIKYLQEEKII